MNTLFNHRWLGAAIVCVVLLWAMSAEAAGSLDSALSEARIAGAPESALTLTLGAADRHGLSETALEPFIALLGAAAREELPVAPLAEKIVEGLAKGAPPAAISRVLEQMLARFRFARRTALASLTRYGAATGLTSGAVARMGDVLAAGLTEQEFESFLRAAPAGDVAEYVNALEFMASFKQLEIEPDGAQSALLAGLGGNFFKSTDWDLIRALKAAKDRGVSSSVLLASAAESLQGDLTTIQVCDNLGLDPSVIGLDRRATTIYASGGGTDRSAPSGLASTGNVAGFGSTGSINDSGIGQAGGASGSSGGSGSGGGSASK